jgi:hypothetical protein
MPHRQGEVRIRVTRARVALAALVVTLVATGSIGWAAIGDGGTVQGCVANNGTIDAIDPVTQACKDRQTPVEWYTKAGADAAFLGIASKAADADNLDGRDASSFAPTFIASDELAVSLPIDIDLTPFVCMTAPYTPTTNQVARVDSWVSVLANAGSNLSFFLINVVSTDGGTTWLVLDSTFPRAGGNASEWAHGSSVSRTNLVAGTTYVFGVEIGRAGGTGDAANAKCEVFVEANYRS